MAAAQRIPGMHPAALLVMYVAVALLPVVLAWTQDLPPRPFRDDLSSALAMAGFAMLLMEFVISGRFQLVSGRIGIDVSMRFHQLVARVLTVFLLVHPWLYSLPAAGGRPGDLSGATSLGLAGAPAGTGWLAWFALILLVVWATFRADVGYRYEIWRLGHGLGALTVALLGLHHAVGAGRYSADATLAGLWYVMTGVAVLSMVHVYLVRPLLRRHRPYRVRSVHKVALRTWEIVIEPLRGNAIDFLPGQFVWLSVNRSPFSITEHPFSMSSCPADRPRVAFTIKEVGDFTSTVGRLPAGAPAYLDGPHGNMVMDGRAGAGLALIAGGVGVAPIMSLLRQARHEGEARPIRLLYGNRIQDQIAFRQELEDMRADLDLQVHHVLSEPPDGWTGKVGQLDAAMLAECLPMADRAQWLYMVCGPAAMIDAVEHDLAALGIPLRQIVSEKFSYD